jgi:nucleoside-diphosphate kinase
MSTNSDDRYVFVVEWYDSAASLVRTYNLTYYLKDKTIEMFDLKSRKMFLKKTEYSNIQLKDFFIGAVVNIYSRQLKIIDYAD